MDRAYAELLFELSSDVRNIILFVSDHGLHFGREYPGRDKRAWDRTYGSNEKAIVTQFAHHKQPFSYLIIPKSWKGWEGEVRNHVCSSHCWCVFQVLSVVSTYFSIHPPSVLQDGLRRKANMDGNQARLCSHFDMYHTLMYILTGYSVSHAENMAKIPEQPTLFDDLGHRTCEEAGITAQSCACMEARRHDDGREVSAFMTFICRRTYHDTDILEPYGFCLG